MIDIIENGNPGQIYNISSDRIGYMENLEIIEKVCRYAGADFNTSIEHVADRLGHDTSYFIYNYVSKSPEENNLAMLEKNIEDTVHWYIENL